MSGTWLSIRVELVSGRSGPFWPRPGRIFAASRSHTFHQLAEAIEIGFARWDHSHLHVFHLADGHRVGVPDLDDFDSTPLLDDRRTTLARLDLEEQFSYVFDFGDEWEHLCTVGPSRIDPGSVLGIVPDRPLPYWGWGTITDQYDRRWEGDDGESRPPSKPRRNDLPDIRPWKRRTARTAGAPTLDVNAGERR